MKKYSLGFILILLACNVESFAENLTLESPAFKLNAMIPADYTCNGADKSPPLTWSDAPPQTQSFALIVEDPDAPGGVFTHWILFNIPPNITELDAGTAVPEGAAQGKNNWGVINYRGPCPANGMHTYIFKLFALNKLLSLEEGASSDAVRDAMTGYVLGSSEWVGVYQKQ